MPVKGMATFPDADAAVIMPQRSVTYRHAYSLGFPPGGRRNTAA
jgi:hypothetical protein